jgi:hypothetical protein
MTHTRTLTCWCNAATLAWVVDFALTFNTQAIRSIAPDGRVADYRLELDFKTEADIQKFIHVARDNHKLV